jgi:hypothetical protein
MRYVSLLLCSCAGVLTATATAPHEYGGGVACAREPLEPDVSEWLQQGRLDEELLNPSEMLPLKAGEGAAPDDTAQAWLSSHGADFVTVDGDEEQMWQRDMNFLW